MSDLPDYITVCQKEVDFSTPVDAVRERACRSIYRSANGFDWRCHVAIEGDHLMAKPIIRPFERVRFWTLELEFTVTIKSIDGTKDRVTRKSYSFSNYNLPKNGEKMDLGSVNEICAPSAGLVSSLDLLVNFHVDWNVKSSSGVYERQEWPLSDQLHDLADFTVIVEGRRIAVPKSYLSYHSEYFRSLIYGDLHESDTEATITGLTYNSFYDWVQVILPSGGFICEDNAEDILKAAKLLESEDATEMVDDFLCDDTVEDEEYDLAWKFRLAERYMLKKLKAKMGTKMLTSIDDVKKVMKSNEYRNFKSSEKIALLDCIKDIVTSEESEG